MTVVEYSPISEFAQRWRHGSHSWRHRRDGGFDQERYTVEAIDELTAKRFVVEHHYAHSMPAAMQRYGLFDQGAELEENAGALVGVVVLGAPVSTAALTNVFPGLNPFVESAEVSRLIVDPSVAANGESWFMARVFEHAAARGTRGLISFADPMPRIRADGTEVKKGHVGVVYSALNAVYCGRSTRRTLTLLPDGTVLNDRSAQKIRRQERGHAHVEARLVALGAPVMRAGQAPAAWLADSLDAIGATRQPHPGNHRFAWRIGETRAQRRSTEILGAVDGGYPKRHAA